MARVKLYYSGLKEIADSPEMHKAIRAVGDAVADQINSGGYVAESRGKESGELLRAEVEVKSDPAVAKVRVKHPAALAMQAKRGMFSRAASAVGLQIKNDD